MPDQSQSATTVLRWTVEVNREDLPRNDITKPSVEWEPSDLAIAAAEIRVEESKKGKARALT
jgi:hypothetical protein